MIHGSDSKLGLFADGPVGKAVFLILLESYPDRLAYVVVPTRDSELAACWKKESLDVPLLYWSDMIDVSSPPRYVDGVPDIILLAWWPFIVGPSFLNAGQKLTLNMHPSLLPYGRGKDPNFWALVDREPFGVTIHHVDEGIDSGDIAFQTSLAVSWEDTGATLYSRAQTALVELLRSSLDRILSLSVPRIPQDVAGGSFHRRADIDPRSRIDLGSQCILWQLLDLLRARTFPPHPGCRFSDATGTYEIHLKINRIGD